MMTEREFTFQQFEAPKPVRPPVPETSLTVQAERPYATSGDIFIMPEANPEAPQAHEAPRPVEVPFPRAEGQSQDIITGSHAPPEMENPVIRSMATEFEAEREQFPLSDQSAWPTKRLKDEYKRWVKTTMKASSEAVNNGLSAREQPAAEAQPYIQLILNELRRRGEDTTRIFQEAHAEQRVVNGLRDFIRPGTPGPINPGPAESGGQAPGEPNMPEAQGYDPLVDPAFQEYAAQHQNLPQEAQMANWLAARARGLTPEQERERIESEGRRGRPLNGLEGMRGERNIQSLDQFLEEIMSNSDPKWRRGGEFALVKEVQGREEINQENFLRWIRDRMVFFHNESPNEEFSMFQKVRLQREYRDISINDMLENQDRYFRSADRKFQYSELADQIRREVWQFNYWRGANIEYNLLMGDDGKIQDVINKRFYYNDATRTVWGKSMLAHTFTLPEKFDSKPAYFDEEQGLMVKPDQEEQDARVGIAMNTAFLTYFYISDYEKLTDLLGADAPLLQINKIREAIIETATANKEADPKRFIQDKLTHRILDGDPSLKESDIIQFINIYNSPEKPARIIEVVRKLIAQSVQKKFTDIDPNAQLNDIDADYAEQFAFIKTRLLGAGWRNDLAANANDAGAKPGKLKAYRMKQASPKRGGAIGNPYNIHMMKQLMVDFLTGSRTETWRKNPDGTDYVDHEGNKHYYTPLELMEQMEKQGLDSARVQEISRRMIFPENTQRQYALNHVRRAFDIYHDVTENAEINWEKLTIIDPIAGVRFNRAGFEEEVKEKFFKKMRYAFSTYGQLDFSQKIRAQVEVLDEKTGEPTGKTKWEDQELALAMFGYELLDIHEFHKHDHKGRVMKDKYGRNVLDFEKINNDKAQLWKQLALGRLAAEFYAHRDIHSTDPRYNEIYYMDAIEALELIPGDIMGSEFDFKTSKQSGHFFSHHDVQWLREKAQLEQWRLYRSMVIKDVFKGSADGLKKALKLYWQALIER